VHTSFKYKSFIGLGYSSDSFLIMYAVIYTQPLFFALMPPVSLRHFLISTLTFSV